MNQDSSGLEVSVQCEGEPVARHFLGAGDQITIGPGKNSDIQVDRDTTDHHQMLVRGAGEKYVVWVPPGATLSWSCWDAAGGDVYRAADRGVARGSADRVIQLDHRTRAELLLEPWNIRMRPRRAAPTWAAPGAGRDHTTVRSAGFRQAMTWHRTWRATRDDRRIARAWFWPFLLLSAAVHAAALFILLSVPPDPCCSCYRLSTRKIVHIAHFKAARPHRPRAAPREPPVPTLSFDALRMQISHLNAEEVFNGFMFLERRRGAISHARPSTLDAWRWRGTTILGPVVSEVLPGQGPVDFRDSERSGEGWDVFPPAMQEYVMRSLLRQLDQLAACHAPASLASDSSLLLRVLLSPDGAVTRVHISRSTFGQGHTRCFTSLIERWTFFEIPRPLQIVVPVF